VKSSGLALLPIGLRDANAFVTRHHRHHRASRGHKFSLACMTVVGGVHGVAICGRPVSKTRDDGITLEIVRCCTDGARNACSFLYGACRRAAVALGYRQVITYTLKSEGGASLRAAGFRVIAETRGGSWDRPSRRRVDKHPTEPKLVWAGL
jgi:hypothetical protein